MSSSRLVLQRSSLLASRRLANNVTNNKNQQKRGFIDYLVNYPDRINEIKKVQMAGGTCQGEKNPTWLKQPGDTTVALVGLGLVGVGLAQWVVGLYHLASGKGKMD